MILFMGGGGRFHRFGSLNFFLGGEVRSIGSVRSIFPWGGEVGPWGGGGRFHRFGSLNFFVGGG